jgi:hypothetical protein
MLPGGYFFAFGVARRGIILFGWSGSGRITSLKLGRGAWLARVRGTGGVIGRPGQNVTCCFEGR